MMGAYSWDDLPISSIQGSNTEEGNTSKVAKLPKQRIGVPLLQCSPFPLPKTPMYSPNLETPKTSQICATKILLLLTLNKHAPCEIGDPTKDGTKIQICWLP